MTEIRTGMGFDAHRFAKNRRLILGGVEIDNDLGLEGHSDADVLCHAIADALLGAAADGDIGDHFPDTDDKWKDADSLDILKTVAERLRLKNINIVNIDSTVIAQVPRIAPYRDAMREKIANAIGITVDRVSVKASTVEGMGALGRKEGIAVISAATVRYRNRG